MSFPGNLFRNPGTKLLALAIACVTWYVLTGERRERISERSYRIPLSIVNIPAGTLIVSPLPDAVDVRLRGAFTPLRQLEPSKLEAVVDLADAEPGEKRYTLEPGDINVPRDVEVIAISPAGDPGRPRRRRRQDRPDRPGRHRPAGRRLARRRGVGRAAPGAAARPGPNARPAGPDQDGPRLGRGPGRPVLDFDDPVVPGPRGPGAGGSARDGPRPDPRGPRTDALADGDPPEAKMTRTPGGQA